MNPLPNEWAIKHRADACAVTHRPFAVGEYFYTLLFHDADGYRREDLSEEAWRNRNENIHKQSANGRILIYEHGATGDVFIVTDPQLRLDELENVQNEVAQLLHTAA